MEATQLLEEHGWFLDLGRHSAVGNSNAFGAAAAGEDRKVLINFASEKICVNLLDMLIELHVVKVFK